QERSAARAARDDGALPQARRESRRRLPADAAADSDLLRALPGRGELCRVAERAVPLLRLPPAGGARHPGHGSALGRVALDLQPGRYRPALRSAARDGCDDVRAAEDDACLGRSRSGEGHADHARFLHHHVPQPAVRPGAVLDRVEYPADLAAVVDEPPGGARGRHLARSGTALGPERLSAGAAEILGRSLTVAEADQLGKYL